VKWVRRLCLYPGDTFTYGGAINTGLDAFERIEYVLILSALIAPFPIPVGLRLHCDTRRQSGCWCERALSLIVMRGPIRRFRRTEQRLITGAMRDGRRAGSSLQRLCRFLKTMLQWYTEHL